MTLTLAAQHVGVGHPQIAYVDLTVVVTTRHRFHIAYQLPTVRRQIDDEAGVGGLRQIRIFFGAGDQHGELRAPGTGNKPLVTVDNPLVTVAIGEGLDERRVRSGDLGFGHRKARAGGPLAQRPEILFLLLLSSPMQQGVLVAFVGCLRVQHVWPDRHLGRLGRYCSHGRWAEAHPAPLDGHMRQP
jgi:hypothetical protein